MFMNKLIIIISGVFLLFSCSTNKKSDHAALQAALSDFNKGDFISCQAKLKEYTIKYPDDSKAWSFWGTVAFEMENDSLASEVLGKALSLNPKDFKALTGLGVLAKKNKEYDKAARYYNEAISIDPTYGKAYSSLLVIELKRGNYITAVDLGEKALTLDPKGLEIKSNLAVAYHFAKQYEKRDSLVNEITAKGYPYLDNLKLIFSGVATLDDL
jgi:Flp pilus assembly protein TadD